MTEILAAGDGSLPRSVSLDKSRAGDQADPAGEGAKRRDRQAFWVAATLWGLQDAVYGLVLLSFMHTYLLRDLKAGAAAPGYTLAVFSAFVLVTNPLAGVLLDMTSPRTVLVGAVLAQGASVGLLLLTHSLEGVLAGSAMLAIGAGATWPVIYQVVAATQPEELRPQTSASLAIVGYLSTAGGAGVGVVLASLAPSWLAFGGAGALVFAPLGFLGLSCLAPSQRAAEPQRASASAGEVSSLPLFAMVILMSYTAVAAIAGSYGAYMEVSLGLSLLEAVPYFLPAGGAALAALLLTPRLSHRDRRSRELTGLFALATVGAVALGLASTPLRGALAAIPLAIGVAGAGPLVAATMLDAGRGKHRGLIFGTLMSVEGIGAVLGPLLAATAVAVSGPRAGILIVGATYAALVVLLLTTRSDRYRRD